jgi:UDP-3-O-[3-hydroxymyristoyl] glucosamine N-acyltransferase
VEHDNVLEDYVHISPSAALGGTVHVGSQTHIGIGAVVRNNMNICSGCTIGAGAVVVKNIVEPGTYVGVPARKK